MQHSPADHVERWTLERLVPFARNARTHSASQIDQIAASMRESGWTNPVMVATGWSVGKKRAYVIADNKLALNAGWNEELLAAELGDLKDFAFDLDLVCFDASELDRLLGASGARDGEGDVPGLPDTPVSRAGDLWQMGTHGLLCADATCAADVARLLGGVLPQLMVTDPPYGVAHDPSWRNVSSPPGSTFAARSSGPRSGWCSAAAIMTGSMSPACMRCAPTAKRAGAGDWKQTTVWPIASRDQDAQTVHGTQEPVECMRRPMLNNSNVGQGVYEPFMGLGTTLVAAETCGRTYLGLELDPAYVDVAVTRWHQLTGETPTLEGEEASFADISAVRLASCSA